MSSDYNDFNRRMVEDFRANRGIPSFGPFKDRRDILLLTTTGARTGEPRVNPLAYSRDGQDLVVIASKGGAPDHPAWYHNLVKNPTVTVEVGTERLAATAHVAEGAERRRLFDAQATLLPTFWEYEKKTSRQIPVVVLKRS